MPSTDVHIDVAEKSELSQSAAAWQRIRQQLETERQRIVDEIVHYPPPIPRCDVQYNTLLEERASITQEIYRLEKLSQEVHTAEDDLRLLDEFVRSSIFLGGEAGHKL